MRKVFLGKLNAHSEQRKGFTLIELLVVLAIIAVLAAILFPVFARARENARRATCMSNLKQIGLGMMMYVQDNDERYPGYYYAGTTAPGPDNGGEWASGTYWWWQNMIYPYIRSVTIFICPSSSAAGTAYKAPNGVGGPYTLNYGINVGTTAVPFISTGAGPSMTKVVDAANTYLVMDSSFYTAGPAYASGPPTSTNYFIPGTCALFPSTTIPTTSFDCWNGRHFSGVNVLFADGHVKWLATSTVSAQALSAGGGAWSPSNP